MIVACVAVDISLFCVSFFSFFLALYDTGTNDYRTRYATLKVGTYNVTSRLLSVTTFLPFLKF